MRKLSESIWSDIQDRSSGETIRKEDDINLLDRDGLYDYLTSHYKNTNSFEPIYNSDAFNTIKVPFLIQGGSDGVYLSFEENEVSIPYASPYKVKGLFSKLADEFSLKSDSKTGHTWYIISPKDGSKVTNTFYIYVIDFLIDNIPDSFERGVKKIVNESIWSDIQDRSTGETVRKEDDIDHLDSEGLYEYLKNIYKELDSFQSIKLHPTMNTISVPIFVKGFKPYRVFFEFDNEEIFIEHAMAYAITGFFSKLWGKFYLQRYDTKQGMPAKFYIFPKDGSDITNRFFIEVIDFLLDCIPNSDDKCIERIVNESIWSDIQDRSAGEIERKEDNVDLFDPNGFTEYLNYHYTPVDYGDQARYDNIGGSELVVIDVFAFKPFIAALYYHYSQNEVILSSIYADAVKEAYPEFFTKLEDAFSIEVKRDGHNSNSVIFNPKDNSPASNTFFIEVLDKLIEVVGEWNPKSKVEPLMKKNDHISESIWSDIQDRSTGEIERKEDEIVSNIKELKPVDMGVSVLWADRDLESDENVYFSFLDANKIIKNSGWRLPTFNEMSELTRCSAIYKNTFEECKLHYYKTHSDLTFEKCGYQYADEDRVLDCDSYYAWTSDTAKSGSEAYQTIFIRKHIAAVPMHYMNRCCVRLVKDK